MNRVKQPTLQHMWHHKLSMSWKFWNKYVIMATDGRPLGPQVPGLQRQGPEVSAYRGDMLTLPYVTLPYGEGVLPPSAEASNEPNAHPRTNRKVTKSPSAVLTWVHTNSWNHPRPKRGPTHLNLLTNIHSWYLQENISSKVHKHIHPGHHVQQDSKPGNHCAFSKHTLYIIITL